jgi:hypothetical protein
VRRLLKTPEQKLVLISGVLGILVSALLLLDSVGAVNQTTFIDAIPPEEFLTTEVDAAIVAGNRHPSSSPLSGPQILKSQKKFDDLNRQERRTLYNAVMYFCNEERDDRECKSYVSYCGKSCQLLVQASSPAR